MKISTDGITEFERMLKAAPKVTFFHTRDAVGHMLAKGRTTVKERAPRNLAKNIGTSKSRDGRGWIKFVVHPNPAANSKKKLEAAVRTRNNLRLRDIHGFIGERSPVVLTHEFGPKILPKHGRYLKIPVRREFREPSFTRKRRRQRDRAIGPLFVKKRKRGGKNRLVLAREHPSKRTAKGNPVIETVFALVPSLQFTPKLRIRATWRSLAAWRRRRLKEAARRILQDIARGNERKRFSAARDSKELKDLKRAVARAARGRSA